MSVKLSRKRTITEKLRELQKELGAHAPLRLAEVFIHAGLLDSLSTPITIFDLADQLDVKASTVSRDVSRLAGYGRGKDQLEKYITLEEYEGDRRYKYIKLTARGRKLLAKIIDEEYQP